MINVGENSKSWLEFLKALAAEAARDAESIEPSMALHGVLRDLSNVALAYAGRIDLIRGEEIKLSLLAEVGDSERLVNDPVAAESEGPVSPSVLPSQQTETKTENEGPAYEARIAALEYALSELALRVEDLERNQNKVSITPTPPFAMDDEQINEDRATWNSVDSARAALRALVNREHKERSASRQAILARIASLASVRDPDEALRAEIVQHQARAEEFGSIDVIRDVKLDEIAAIDDLLELREFNEKKGWPE